MKNKKLVILPALVLGLGSLSGCSFMPTVTWVNYDGTILEVDKFVMYGEYTKYNSEKPSKPSTAQYDYVFIGWDNDTAHAGRVYKNRTITAQFKEVLRRYEITWNVEGNISTTMVSYGNLPEFTPENYENDNLRAVFDHWEPEITEVTGPAAYRAVFNKTNKYTITFDVNGTKTTKLYLDGTDASKISVPAHEDYETDEGKYTFVGWQAKDGTMGIKNVSGSQTYTAVFDKTNKYSVTFDVNGTKTTKLYLDGTDASKISVPAHEDYENDSCKAVFDHWEPSISDVTEDVTYTAIYNITNKYTVTFDIEGETTSNLYLDGTAANKITIPTVSDYETDEYKAEFIGWDKEITDVCENATYTAQYKKYYKRTITFVTHEGTTEEEYFDETPASEIVLPTTEDWQDNQFDYTFDHWDKEIASVSEDTTYTAVYAKKLRKFTVSWQDEDGTVLKTSTNVEYGTTVHYDLETPTKEKTDEFKFEFNGWDKDEGPITEDTVYTAQYTSIARTSAKFEYYICEFEDDMLVGHEKTTDSSLIFEIPYDETLTLVKLEKTGYDFDWYLEPTCDSSSKISGNIEDVKNDMVFFGRFIPKTYNISFDGIDQIDESKEIFTTFTEYTVEDDDTLLPEISRLGYDFDGYFIGDTKLVNNTFVAEDYAEDVEIVAKWSQYEITFVGMDAPVKYDDALPTTYCHNLETISLPVPTKDDYFFEGYYIGDTKLINNKFDCTAYSENITIEAKWSQYKINYIGIDGTEDAHAALPETFCKSSDTFNLPELTKNRWVFDGYFLNGDDERLTNNKFDPTGITEDVTIEAKWHQDTNVINFDLDGGHVPVSVTFMDGEEKIEEYSQENLIIGDEIEYPVLDNKEGKQFAGWSNKPESAIQEDTVITAVWNDIAEGVVDMPIDSEEYVNVELHNLNDTYIQVTSLIEQDLRLVFEDKSGIPTIEAEDPFDRYITLRNVDGNYYESVNTYHINAGETFMFAVKGKQNADSSINVKVVGENQIVDDSKITVADNQISSIEGCAGDVFVSPTTPYKEGYIFDGWINEQGVKYEDGDILEKGEINLSATWIKVD